jgi:hypothetical protein
VTNEERRRALAKARSKALEYAEQTEVTNYDDAYEFSRSRALACMWANVANALKIGENIDADGVIPGVDPTGYTITR